MTVAAWPLRKFKETRSISGRPHSECSPPAFAQCLSNSLSSLGSRLLARPKTGDFVLGNLMDPRGVEALTSWAIHPEASA